MTLPYARSDGHTAFRFLDAVFSITCTDWPDGSVRRCAELEIYVQIIEAVFADRMLPTRQEARELEWKGAKMDTPDRSKITLSRNRRNVS